jgi:choline dehydrogenase-like flavoprotein
VIDYHIDDYAFAGMALARDVFSAVFDHADIAEVTEDDPHNPGWVERDGRGLVYWGSGHLVGTHRMGADPTRGVTDDSCRAFGHPNLWMVGAGAMPTIGTCNPTLTLEALTLRAAEDMVAKAGALG